MADLASALRQLIRPGESLLAQFNCLSSGLNASPTSGRQSALVYVVPGAVVIGWVKRPGFGKVLAERFERRELMMVLEGDVPITGLEGELARRNAKHPLGRLLGASSSIPAVTIKTRRGDVVLAFTPKNRGQARQLHVLLTDMAG